jgi:hypothetical protein
MSSRRNKLEGLVVKDKWSQVKNIYLSKRNSNIIPKRKSLIMRILVIPLQTENKKIRQSKLHIKKSVGTICPLHHLAFKDFSLYCDTRNNFKIRIIMGNYSISRIVFFGKIPS